MSLKEILEKLYKLLKTHWPAPVVIFAVLAIYAQAAPFGCTDWDDTAIVMENPCLKNLSLASLHSILRPGGVPEEQMYIPLTYLSFFAEAFLFGLKPQVIHMTNILLHCANALLVYLFFLQIAKSRTTAFLTALIFAVHPLQVESVTWIMGRKDLLCTLLSLASIIFCVNFINGGKIKVLLFSFLCFVLAMLSKPSAIILPGLLLLLYYFFDKLDRKALKYFILYLSVSFIIFYINSVTAWGLPGQSLKYVLYRAMFIPWILQGWLERILMISPSSVYYSWYGAIYGSDPFTFTPVLISILLAVAILSAIKFNYRKIAFGLLFTVISAVPAVILIIYSYRDFYTADRYGYFPVTGFFFLIALAADNPGLKASMKKNIMILAAAWILSASYFSFLQVRCWKNAETLWLSRIEDSPTCSTANYNLGNFYFRKGRLDEAEVHYRKSIGAFPDPDAYYNLGILCELQKRNEEAEKYFGRTVSLHPGYLNARRKLAFICYKNGDFDGALDQFVRITQINQLSPEAYLYIGDIFLKKGDKNSAEKSFLIYEKLKGNGGGDASR